MRDIKFRMVTQTTGKLLGYVDIYDLLRNGSDVLPDFDEAVLEGVDFEQYTGLKDKNGKEIYEGDIVRYWSENYEVKFDEIKDSDITYYYLGWAMGELSLYEAASMCEVIGNIHENPELLEGEEDTDIFGEEVLEEGFLGGEE